MNDNPDSDTRSTSSGTSRTRNIGNAYYYTIDGEAFTTISSDEEVVFAVTIGVEQKKEKTKED